MLSFFFSVLYGLAKVSPLLLPRTVTPVSGANDRFSPCSVEKSTLDSVKFLLG